MPTQEQIAMKAAELLLTQKNDPVQAQDALPYLGNGVFVSPGTYPDMYGAVQKPTTGFPDALALVRSEYNNVEYSILTSQTATEGSNPTDTCGTAPAPGVLKECKTRVPFGTLYMSTEKTNLTNVGMLQDMAVSPRTMNNYATSNSWTVPEPLREAVTIGGTDIFRNEALHQFYKLGTAVSRTLAPVCIDGNSTLSNTNAELGMIAEFDGLSRLIKAGHTDAATGDACPAADSAVVEWGGAISGNVTINGQVLTITELVNDLWYSLQVLAEQTGINGSWALVMDKRLFRSLVFRFAADYPLTRVADSTNTTETINRNSGEIQQQAQDMFRRMYLPIMGVEVPVMFTSGRETAEHGSGTLIGDMFIVNMSANGSATTYMEYFPMDNQYIEGMKRAYDLQGVMTMNSGLYVTALNHQHFCVEMVLASKMRMIHRTPFLSARINNITYQQFVNYRDPFPGTTYFYGGGTTKNTPALP